MNDIIASHQSEKYWVELVSFRHLRQIDLPALEWDGEYAHLRRVYAHAFEMTRTGKNCIWVADHRNRQIGRFLPTSVCRLILRLG